MQLANIKGNTIEKILRDKEGRLVRATFYVYENAGRVKARLIDFVYLSEKVLKNTSLALSGFSKKASLARTDLARKSVVSPFLNFEILFFSGCKPRAPTL